MGATHTIAVVVVKTDHDGTPAYIGTSHAADDTTIATEVAERGARFPLDAAAQLPNFFSLIELYPQHMPTTSRHVTLPATSARKDAARGGKGTATTANHCQKREDPQLASSWHVGSILRASR
jgi:hypothetical protein